jgi:CDP-glucose 4,6-dehydratase
MQWSDTSVLITGVDGFVGSHLAMALLAQGAQVAGLLHKAAVAGKSGLLAWNIAQRIESHIGDVADELFVPAVLRAARPEWIFHLAAQTIVTRAETDPFQTLDTNVRGTYVLLTAAALLPHLQGIIVASSDKAYGPSPVLPYTENMPLRGGSVYNSSKVCTELVATSVAVRFDLPLAITRCANIYGPGDFQFSRIVPDSARALARGEPPTIRGDGRHRRDFLFVDDAVSGYMKLAQYLAGHQVARGEAFNFGTGEPIAIVDLVRSLIECGPSPPVCPVILGRPTPQELPEQSLDSSKARQVLGWRPEVPLPVGLMRTLEWYESYCTRNEV